MIHKLYVIHYLYYYSTWHSNLNTWYSNYTQIHKLYMISIIHDANYTWYTSYTFNTTSHYWLFFVEYPVCPHHTLLNYLLWSNPRVPPPISLCWVSRVSHHTWSTYHVVQHWPEWAPIRRKRCPIFQSLIITVLIT